MQPVVVYVLAASCKLPVIIGHLSVMNLLLGIGLYRPVARNFNWVVLLYKIVDLFNKILDLLSKIVDLFNKIVDLFDKFVAFSNK